VQDAEEEIHVRSGRVRQSGPGHVVARLGEEDFHRGPDELVDRGAGGLPGRCRQLAPDSAAAVSLIPIAIIMIHLFVVRRAGALDNL